jgi:hypothetical protein
MHNAQKTEERPAWDSLDIEVKLKYIDRAEYLISRGYLLNHPDPFMVARMLYQKEDWCNSPTIDRKFEDIKL